LGTDVPHADEIVQSAGMPLSTMPRQRILYVATEDWFSGMARAVQQAGFDMALAARPCDAAPAIG
jgi:hypothetical protein